MLLSQVVAPASTPVSLSEAKAHLRVEHDAEDTLITALIGAVTERLDGRYGWLRRAIVQQTWDYSLPWFPAARCIVLPMPPLQSVTHVKYRDADDVEQTMAADDYQIVATADEGHIHLKATKSWPGATYERPDAVTVRFVAGYTSVPNNIKSAILLEIGQLYANRGDEPTETTNYRPSLAVQRLLGPAKRVLIA